MDIKTSLSLSLSPSPSCERVHKKAATKNRVLSGCFNWYYLMVMQMKSLKRSCDHRAAVRRVINDLILHFRLPE